VEVDREEGGKTHSVTYDAFVTKLGEQTFLNVQNRPSADQSKEGAAAPRPYYLARYRINDAGSMTITLISDEAAAAAVTAKKLRGTITNSGGDRDVTITAPTKALATFVNSTNLDELFSQKFATFQKLYRPDSSPTATKLPQKVLPNKKAASTKSKASSSSKKKPNN
jgi:hypothetical protein